jgi:hypothetical protein
MTCDLDLQKVLDDTGKQYNPEQDEAKFCRLNGRVDKLAAANYGPSYDDARADSRQCPEERIRFLFAHQAAQPILLLLCFGRGQDSLD